MNFSRLGTQVYGENHPSMGCPGGWGRVAAARLVIKSGVIFNE